MFKFICIISNILLINNCFMYSQEFSELDFLHPKKWQLKTIENLKLNDLELDFFPKVITFIGDGINTQYVKYIDNKTLSINNEKYYYQIVNDNLIIKSSSVLLIYEELKSINDSPENIIKLLTTDKWVCNNLEFNFLSQKVVKNSFNNFRLLLLKNTEINETENFLWEIEEVHNAFFITLIHVKDFSKTIFSIKGIDEFSMILFTIDDSREELILNHEK